MTSDAIARRNRANAQKSTGPKTARGKAIVSGNARRHGATGRPDPGSVAAWLAIILDRPDIGPTDLIHADERGHRALDLAHAEAQLVAAEQALRAYEARISEPGDGVVELLKSSGAIVEAPGRKGGTRYKVIPGRSIELLLARCLLKTSRPDRDQHRLLRRYLREARARRWRAFQAWAAVIAPGSPTGSPPGAPITGTKPADVGPGSSPPASTAETKPADTRVPRKAPITATKPTGARSTSALRASEASTAETKPVGTRSVPPKPPITETKPTETRSVSSLKSGKGKQKT